MTENNIKNQNEIRGIQAETDRNDPYADTGRKSSHTVADENNPYVGTGKGSRFQHWKFIAAGLILFDAIAIAVSYFFGLLLRFDFQYSNIPLRYLQAYKNFILIYIIIAIIIFWFMRMYRGIWRFAGFYELIRYALASIIASVVHAVLITLLCERMPISYYIIGAVIQMILVVGVRFSYRFYLQIIARRNTDAEASPARKVMIIGAGAAGRTVIRELHQSDKTNLTPACLIDDNSNKWGRFVEGVPVVGGREDIPNYVQRFHIDEIYLPELYQQIRSVLTPLLITILILYYPACFALKIWLPNYSDSLMYAGLLLPIIIYTTRASLLTNNYLKAYRKEKQMLVINLGCIIGELTGLGIIYLSIKSIEAILIWTIVISAVRSIVSELMVSTLIHKNFIKDIIAEIIMVAIFMTVTIMTTGLKGSIIYGIALVGYFIYKKEDTKTLIHYLRIRKTK